MGFVKFFCVKYLLGDPFLYYKKRRLLFRKVAAEGDRVFYKTMLV